MMNYRLYLNGEWLDTEETTQVVNPATREAFATISTINRTRVAEAFIDAHKASAMWRKTTGKKRGEYLFAIADELQSRLDEVARIITLENGKPLAQSYAEVAMSVDHLRWFAEEARRGYGRIIPNQVESKRHFVIKTPIGVVGAISPWNFPLMLSVRKIAPALAAGCPVILKPAIKTPLSSVLFAECVQHSGLPGGVFQVVCGSSTEIGREFLDNPFCRKITFTGSTEVGQLLIEGSARLVKPLSLELGGHAPVIIFDDADIKAAVEGTLLAKFRNTGQSCIAANRIYVQKSIYGRFLDLFIDRVSVMKVGNGLENGVEIGPLVDEEALTKALKHIENAIEGGGRLLCGGKQVEGLKGYFLEPAVIADVSDLSTCMSEETFAPVAPVCSFESEEEVIRRANASNFGLSAYVFTQNLGRAIRLAESLEVGMVGINDGLPTTSQCPFGGTKHSGWGRELSIEGMDAFLETKHISMGIE